MTRTLYGNKTLNELDPPAWGEPEYPSYLVTACHRLRNKPIGEFSAEDLRIMIGQGIGIRFLLPLALDVLEQDPLVEGDSYPGDLLASVLGVRREFWTQESQWRTRFRALLEGLNVVPEELAKAVASFLDATH